MWLGAAPAVDQAAYVRLMQQGVDALKAGEYEKGLQAFKELEKLVPDDPTTAYNLACSLSLLSKKEEALAYLKKSVELGFANQELFETDTDLNNIRDEKGYAEALAAMKAKATERVEKARQEARAALREALAKDELYPLAFDGKDIEGKPVSLAELKGKVVLVDIWGTWCPPCVREVPNLVKLQKEYGPKGFAVLGLAFERVSDPAEALKKVQEFAKKAEVNYPCATVDREWLKQVPEFRAFPTLILVDRGGKVRFQHVGYSDYEVLAGWVEELLALKAAPPKEGKKTEAKGRWF
jgi:thiol-disulfide isomerase/thioredoxin